MSDFPMGSIVEVDIDLGLPNIDQDIEVNLKGRCRLYVVGIQDGDETKLYTVSDLPVLAPSEDTERQAYRALATVMEYRYGEDLKPTATQPRVLHQDLNAWMQSH